MREIDLTHAFLIIEQLKVSSQKEIQQNHSIEKWRDELLINADSITQFFNQYPNIDRQSLRQAITNAQRERKEKKSPKYSRQLFKLLREIII